VLFGGEVAEVEAAVEAGSAWVGAPSVAHVVIAQLHTEMRENLDADPRFSARVEGVAKTEDSGAGSRPKPPAGDRPKPGTGGTLERPASPKKPAGTSRRARTRSTAARTTRRKRS
jgi:hypothetical protein